MISCHCRIIPSFLLSNRATLTGIRSWTSVISSWNVIWKPPSPVIAHVSRSGRPTAAPIAAGTLKPIVPRPPELTWLFCSGRPDAAPPGAGHPAPHRPEPPRADVAVRCVHPGVAAQPHLVLADVADIG